MNVVLLPKTSGLGDDVPFRYYENKNTLLSEECRRCFPYFFDGPQKIMCGVVSAIDWSKTQYSGRIIQTYSCGVTNLQMNLQGHDIWISKTFFEVAVGTDLVFIERGRMMGNISKVLKNETEIYNDNLSKKVINFEDQTHIFNTLHSMYYSDEARTTHLIFHFKRIMRVSASNAYFGEDILLLICAAIEGLMVYMVSKRTGEDINDTHLSSKTLQNELKSFPELEGIHKTWNETRQALAHGKFHFSGRPVYGYDYFNENITPLLNAAIFLFCSATNTPYSKDINNSVYNQP